VTTLPVQPEAQRQDGPVTEAPGAPRSAWTTPPAARMQVRQQRAKRLVDVLGAGLLLGAFAPVIGLAAVAVRLDSPGPVLFRQTRIGRGGRPFSILKFRTMVADAEERRLELVASSRDSDWLLLDRDPRVTRLGRLLRRTSIDELPQLVNVLRGNMSLVGPRPLIRAEHARLPSWARTRLDVAPGMTGLWQVSGRTTIPFAQMLELDRSYVETWSLRGDLVLLARTVPEVLLCRGAN
jgi:lipopolysaccharide/colanic/teichoic acid biosynthesis glycosyltransferase